jgi:hypothetical protein
MAADLKLRLGKELEVAEQRHADAYLFYLREAKAAGWSWRRIARTIGAGEKTVREYWSRHQMRAGRLPDVVLENQREGDDGERGVGEAAHGTAHLRRRRNAAGQFTVGARAGSHGRSGGLVEV